MIARGGGRGLFCVKESGGATIDDVDSEDTRNNSILIESCYNITIGSSGKQSRIASSGELRKAKRSDLAPLTFCSRTSPSPTPPSGKTPASTRSTRPT